MASPGAAAVLQLPQPRRPRQQQEPRSSHRDASCCGHAPRAATSPFGSAIGARASLAAFCMSSSALSTVLVPLTASKKLLTMAPSMVSSAAAGDVAHPAAPLQQRLHLGQHGDRRPPPPRVPLTFSAGSEPAVAAHFRIASGDSAIDLAMSQAAFWFLLVLGTAKAKPEFCTNLCSVPTMGGRAWKSYLVLLPAGSWPTVLASGPGAGVAHHAQRLGGVVPAVAGGAAGQPHGDEGVHVGAPAPWGT